MDAKRTAAGGEPDDEVFGPIEDGEEVFEWIDDSDAGGADGARATDAKAPSPSFRERYRERVAAMRAGGEALSLSRRKIMAGAASLVLACAVGGACTAWFDGVAGASDRAGEVSLAVDSVTDGDPAAAKYDAGETTATGEYVVEFANNSPDAVTLASVGFDAGTLMSSTGWKPVGPARIPGGGTGKAALTVKLFCPMVMLGVQTGGLGVAGIDGAGGSTMPFPALDVKVRDGNGDQRDLVLATHVTVASQASNAPRALASPAGNGSFVVTTRGNGGFINGGDGPTPQIVTAGAGACGQWLTDRIAQRDQSQATTPVDVGGGIGFGSGGDQSQSGVSFTYDKVLAPAKGNAFTLAITVKNTADHKLTLNSHTGQDFNVQIPEHVDWQPASLDLDPGQSKQVQVTVHFTDCGVGMLGIPPLSLTMVAVTDDSTTAIHVVYPEQALSGSLRLARDLAKQMKAACG